MTAAIDDDAVPADVIHNVIAADPLEAVVDSLVEETIRHAEKRRRPPPLDAATGSPGGVLERHSTTAAAPRTIIGEWGSSLYVGDLTMALRSLVRAEFELYALQRYAMAPDIAAAVEEMTVAATALLDLGKWTQNRLRGIDWVERPAVRLVAAPPVESVVDGSPGQERAS
jgi:hypothetical protein